MRGADVGMDHVIHNISEFLGVLNRYKNEFSTTSHNDNFIFRGMSTASWKLLPGIFREYSKPETTSDVVSQKQYRKMYRSNESEILAHFRKEASGFLTNISQNDDFTWLQYAQHYGVPTRLLDFTANPLVALYFSCQSESKDDSVVWIININNFQRWSHDEDICKSTNTREIVIDRIMCEMRGDFIHMENSKRPPLKERPLFFLPPYIDQRMSAQASRFMLWGTNQFALEDMIDEENWMKLTSEAISLWIENDQRFLANIIIPAECKHSIIEELDLLNISSKTIFPGLDGIGRYINKYYQNPPKC